MAGYIAYGFTPDQIVRHGWLDNKAVCNFKEGAPPKEWPDNHSYVDARDPAKHPMISCKDCKHVIKESKKAATA